MTELFRQAEQLQDQLVAWRRDLHRIPETGLVLPQTAAYVQKVLTERGLTWQEYPGHSGMTVRIGGGPGMPTGDSAGCPLLGRAWGPSRAFFRRWLKAFTGRENR